MSNALVLKFRSMRHPLGIRREVLLAIAQRLEVSQSRAAETAISRLYLQLCEDTEHFDFPSDKVLAARDRSCEDHGPIIRSHHIADYFGGPKPKRTRNRPQRC